MTKENCLMGITVFDLKEKELITKIYRSLKDDKDFALYNNYIIDLNRLVLFDLETKEYLYGDDIDEWDFEDILNNYEKYLCFNIDWLDKTLEYEIDNIASEIFQSNNTLKIIKDNAFRPIPSFEGRTNLFQEFKSVRTKYMVLCFEYGSWYDEYNREYNSDCTFKGIVNMNKIEVYSNE